MFATPLHSEKPGDQQRAAVLIAVAGAGAALTFSELRRGLQWTDGNLGSHLRILERAGQVVATGNGARGRASRTSYALTPAGRDQLAQWREHWISWATAAANALAAHEAAMARPAPLSSMPARLSALPETPPEPAAEGVSIVDERYSGPD